MPHPTPVQIAYGSATVISITFFSLFLAPAASGPVVVLIAVLALLLGAAVAVAATRHTARHTAGRRRATPGGTPEPARGQSSFTAPERPGVRV
ncbi:hypothetical protein [Streptomyces sp. MP131-18]|uniref:hypothetical protein n=1 Tax=Streptomyces sp. MP131-18 TaxID=1857892 RepID=UPI00097C22B9|nr:hypothetical protein [Streptomyces sp. MP131-18]ONK13969.1 hypothetical protein STBA_47460 [Streptomyces sp. MP131-18]